MVYPGALTAATVALTKSKMKSKCLQQTSNSIKRKIIQKCVSFLLVQHDDFFCDLTETSRQLSCFQSFDTFLPRMAVIEDDSQSVSKTSIISLGERKSCY